MTSLTALQKKAAELRKALAQVDRLTGRQSERDKDALKKQRSRAAEKIVVVPKCADRSRRDELEKDTVDWLRWYFDECAYYTESVFWYPFTWQQLRMIRSIDRAIDEGGDQSLAASRGEGKTTIARRTSLKAALTGRCDFIVMFAATGGHAEDSLQAIQHDIEFNERLCADYPEVCVPVRALENTPQRAHFQIASGFRHDNGEPYEAAQTRFSWCGQQVRFPNVPGSPSASAIIATRGLDSQVVGLNKLGRRPKLAIIDDPDTDDTVYSEQQSEKLRARIDRSIGGLGGQQKPIARVGLWTVRSRVSVAWHYSDGEKSPSWHPERFRFLVKPPANMELWDEYVALVQSDWRDGTDKAEQLYLSRREEMDAGSEVANKYRFAKGEHSAIQHYYNLIARFKPETVATEYDNDPPADDSLLESGITAHLVETRTSGLDRCELPRGCIALTAFMDLGHSWCHWAVTAWTEHCIGYVVDYGRQDVFGIDKDSSAAALEYAFLSALRTWRNDLIGTAYRDADGNTRQIDLAFIDSGSGLHAPAVYAFCAEAGAPFAPAKGFGGSAWHAIKPAPGRKTYDNAHATYQQDKRVWLFDLNADYWKKFVHQRFLTEPFDANHQRNPGSLSLFSCPDVGQLKKDRREYSHQIVAEIWAEKYIAGKGHKAGWVSRGKNNHWLDATAGACAAAAVKGVSLAPRKPKVDPASRPSAQELAARAKPLR